MSPLLRAARAVAVGVAAGLLTAAGAWGGVEGTHHDMRLYNPGSEQGVCAYCHVPHRAQSADNLFARVGSEGSLGPIGSFCYSCHDGTVVPTALVEAPDGTVGLEALTGSHGYTVARIAVVTEGLETAESVLSSGLIKATGPDGTTLARFDCDACHDPHADQFAPFLRAPLAELCQRCHSGLQRTGKGRWTVVEDRGAANGAHPVGMAVAESGLDRVRPYLASEKTFHGPAAVFDVPARLPEQLRDPNVHWATGGHLLGAGRTVGCPTCHSAHLPRRALLVANATADVEKVVCSGCHGDGKNPENPGATPNYHPVLDSSRPPYVHDHASHGLVAANPSLPATGTLDLFVQVPASLPLGPSGQLQCGTCHRAHRGRSGERCLRGGPTRAPVICNECHGTGDQPAGKANIHHPVALKDYSRPEFGEFPKHVAWYQGPGLPGDLSDGLQCVDCHVELAKSGHNW